MTTGSISRLMMAIVTTAGISACQVQDDPSAGTNTSSVEQDGITVQCKTEPPKDGVQKFEAGKTVLVSTTSKSASYLMWRLDDGTTFAMLADPDKNVVMAEYVIQPKDIAAFAQQLWDDPNQPQLVGTGNPPIHHPGGSQWGTVFGMQLAAHVAGQSELAAKETDSCGFKE